MASSIYLEVEENSNCDYMPLMLYEAHSEPVAIHKIILDDPEKDPGTYDVVGWSSTAGGSPCEALYLPVSDSGQAVVHLVYGGDWGIRLRKEGSNEGWDVTNGKQYGEPYLMLMDSAAIILVD